MQIVISASQIPTIIGKNRFKKIEDVFLEVWKRSNRNQFLNVQQKVLCKHDEVLYDGRNEFDRRRSSNKNKCIRIDRDKCHPSYFPTQRFPPPIKKQYITTATKDHSSNQQYGKRNETFAMNYYQHVNKTRVLSKGIYHKRLFQNDALGILSDVVIVGEVDGFTEDGKVIEVKCRKERFFDSIDREIAQLQTYLWICKKNRGQLVQYLPISSSDQRLKIQNVAYDHQIWTQKMAPRIEMFSTSLDLFMRNDELQQIFLQQPAKRKEIIRSLYIDIASKPLNQRFLGCAMMFSVLQFDLHRF